MLSNRDSETLRGMERRLASDDPALAALLRSRADTVSGRHHRWAHDLVLTLAVLAALPCLLFGAFGSGLVALLFAAGVFMLRRLRFPAQRSAPQPEQPGVTS
ncbi:MAG TPA: DUF3040 domain-containing protein [Pseudonocardia sp.]|jgi:hypothetical protein